MRPERTRLEHQKGKWHVAVRKGAQGASEAAWLSLGGCPDQITAMRVWLAVLTREKR